MKHLLALPIVAVLFTSCVVSDPTLYTWHDYDDAAYDNSKKNTEKTLSVLMKTYKKMGEKQHGTRKTVPPGYNAEYGYQLFKQGKQQEALKALEREIELYPESKTFIQRIIQQVQNQ